MQRILGQTMGLIADLAFSANSCGYSSATFASLRRAYNHKTRHRLVVFSLALLALLLASTIGLATPGIAFGAWPLPSRSEISLGYLCEYASSTGQTHVHHGVDIPASDESRVVSPVDGTVSFIGNVPADDVSGSETMLAVSVEMEDGRTLTLMPFADVSVEQGASVSQGSELGVLAPYGDKSSSATHLHVGLKRGRTYYDPSEILGINNVMREERETGSPVAPIAISIDAVLPEAPLEASSSESASPDSEAVAEEMPISIATPISEEALEAYRAQLGADDAEAERPDSVLSWLSACKERVSFAVSSIFETLGAKGLATAIAFALAFISLAIYLAVYRRDRGAQVTASEDIGTKKGRIRRIFVRLIKRFRPLAN